MAVFRVERTGDYTVMSNFHLKDKRLSLKAKGLLSQMLSLPDDWDYTLSGLSYINRESKDAIRSAVNELETAGYIRRRQTTDASGKFAANEYTIFERPIEGEPMLDKPLSENPITVNPSAVNPLPENPTQLNTKKSNTQKQNTHGSNTDSIPFRETAAVIPPERKGRDAMSVTEIENYRELILENIEYDCLKQRYPLYLDDLNEIVELLVETVCAKRKTTRISGADFPHEIVRSRFLKLDSSHIEFVMDCLQMCCDFAIHDPDPPGHNPHCHFMLTMRAIDENGKWMPKSRKVYEERTKAKKKAEIEARKQAIRTEDIARGVFIPVSSLPQLGPRKGA